MTTAKRNKGVRKVGHGRGVPVRLAGAIARKYSLSHIIIHTNDQQRRQRILYWARNDQAGVQCAHFSGVLADVHGWSDVPDFDCSSVRRMKDRIKDLELQLARIYEREGDPREIARVALNLPEDL